MRALRWFEAVSGILASVVGGVAIGFLSFGPTYGTSGCQVTSPGAAPVCTTGTATLVQVNGRSAITLLGLIAVLLLAIAIGAVWHSLTGRNSAQWMLWSGAGALTVLAVLGLLSIGLLLLPSVAFALIASVCALADRRPAAAQRANRRGHA